MGFNKRYVNGRGIAASFISDGISGVCDYFTKPDALIIPTGKCWAADIAAQFDKAWNEGNPQDDPSFEKLVAEGTTHMTGLEECAFELKNTRSLETDHELRAYIDAQLVIIDKKLQYYYV